MHARLVFVVEDLDRNESHSFDIQEILAFLQQLKEYRNLTFLLTCGLNAPARIDFAKLCDHIEYLRIVSVEQAGQMIMALRKRSLDQSSYPHVLLRNPDDYQWDPKRWVLSSARDKVPLPEAAAKLLNTPRALRHALQRTYRAWQGLYGEIDWDHLFAINVVRYAAPEVMSFLLIHWHRLCDQPPEHMTRFGQLEKYKSSIREEWNAVCSCADWDARAARALVELILPATPIWLDEDQHGIERRPQGVHGERYWQRAFRESISENEVRDQAVLRDMKEWDASRSSECQLIKELCSSSNYSNVWEALAFRFLAKDNERSLLLCKQVLQEIARRHGPQASSDSQGFTAVWRYEMAPV